MRDINYFGLMICGICVVASLAISIQYGLSISEHWWIALTYAAIGVAAVIWEVMGAHRCAHLWRKGRKFAAGLCAFGFLIATIITIQYELGYLATYFEGNASAGESRAGEREALEAERARLQGQIAAAGTPRPPEAIAAELKSAQGIKDLADRARLAAEKADARAADADERAKTEADRGGCAEICRGIQAEAAAFRAEAAAHRADHDRHIAALGGTERLARLETEHGAAIGIAAASARVSEINSLLKPLSGSKIADARASYMSQIGGMSEMGARMMVSMLIILFLWFGRAFSPFVFMDARAALADSQKTDSVAAERRETAPAEIADSAAEKPEMEILPAPYDDPDHFDIEEARALYEMEEAEAIAAMNGARMQQPEGLPLEPEADLPERDKRTRRTIQRFIDDCLIMDTSNLDQKEGASVLQDAFRVWLTDKEIVDEVGKVEFGKHMTAILEAAGGERRKSNSWFYHGITIRPAFAHRVAMVMAINDEIDGETEAESGKETDSRRLGRFGAQRRAALFEGLEAAGNA